VLITKMCVILRVKKKGRGNTYRGINPEIQIIYLDYLTHVLTQIFQTQFFSSEHVHKNDIIFN